MVEIEVNFQSQSLNRYCMQYQLHEISILKVHLKVVLYYFNIKISLLPIKMEVLNVYVTIILRARVTWTHQFNYSIDITSKSPIIKFGNNNLIKKKKKKN